jgi:hypothetical protein
VCQGNIGNKMWGAAQMVVPMVHRDIHSYEKSAHRLVCSSANLSKRYFLRNSDRPLLHASFSQCVMTGCIHSMCIRGRHDSISWSSCGGAGGNFVFLTDTIGNLHEGIVGRSGGN